MMHFVPLQTLEAPTVTIYICIFCIFNNIIWGNKDLVMPTTVLMSKTTRHHGIIILMFPERHISHYVQHRQWKWRGNKHFLSLNGTHKMCNYDRRVTRAGSSQAQWPPRSSQTGRGPQPASPRAPGTRWFWRWGCGRGCPVGSGLDLRAEGKRNERKMKQNEKKMNGVEKTRVLRWGSNIKLRVNRLKGETKIKFNEWWENGGMAATSVCP